MAKKFTNRSNFHKPVNIWWVTYAFPTQLFTHQMCHVDKITQQLMVFDIQKAYALQKSKLGFILQAFLHMKSYNFHQLHQSVRNEQ